MSKQFDGVGEAISAAIHCSNRHHIRIVDERIRLTSEIKTLAGSKPEVSSSVSKGAKGDQVHRRDRELSRRKATGLLPFRMPYGSST